MGGTGFAILLGLLLYYRRMAPEQRARRDSRLTKRSRREQPVADNGGFAEGV